MDFQIFRDAKLSQITIKNYTSRILKTLKDFLNKKDIEVSDLSNLDKNAKKIVLMLEKQDKSVNTKKSTYTALYLYARNNQLRKDVQKLYNDKMLDYANESTYVREQNQMSDEEKQNWISFNSLRDLYKTMPEDNVLDVRNKVIVGLYTIIPPLRNDYVNVKIYRRNIKDKPSENYIVYVPKKKQLLFYLNHYKTFNMYGKMLYDWSYSVEPELYNIISKFIDEYKPKYLIPRVNKASKRLQDKSVTETEMSALVPEIFYNLTDKYLTIQLIRRIFETELFLSEDYCKMSIEQKKMLHKRLLHDMNTALEYYRR